MSYGLKVWASTGAVKLDTSDRTVRPTDSIYLAPRSLSATTSAYQNIHIPNFDPGVDGSFIMNAEPGYLDYDGPAVEDGFIPQLEPFVGGVRVIWRGYPQSGSRVVRYMGCYAVILRAGY